MPSGQPYGSSVTLWARPSRGKTDLTVSNHQHLPTPAASFSQTLPAASFGRYSTKRLKLLLFTWVFDEHHACSAQAVQPFSTSPFPAPSSGGLLLLSPPQG